MLKARLPAMGILGDGGLAGAVQAGQETGPMNLPPASRMVPSWVQLAQLPHWHFLEIQTGR
jgi:hypothetical protein